MSDFELLTPVVESDPLPAIVRVRFAGRVCSMHGTQLEALLKAEDGPSLIDRLGETGPPPPDSAAPTNAPTLPHIVRGKVVTMTDGPATGIVFYVEDDETRAKLVERCTNVAKRLDLVE